MAPKGPSPLSSIPKEVQKLFRTHQDLLVVPGCLLNLGKERGWALRILGSSLEYRLAQFHAHQPWSSLGQSGLEARRDWEQRKRREHEAKNPPSLSSPQKHGQEMVWSQYREAEEPPWSSGVPVGVGEDVAAGLRPQKEEQNLFSS
ncbi:hypothetical protein NL676_002135 [Syzygium grande]|nr:hypothetical protein NL676_002135 [Syzygium grande]